MREDRQALLDAGISYLQDGRLPDAVDAFTRVVHLDPDDVHGHFGLGLSCIFAGRLLDATEEFLALKELGADDLAEQLSLARAQAEYPGVFVDGGPGDDFATAFVVRGAPTGSVGIEAEFRHLAGLFGVRGEDWISNSTVCTKTAVRHTTCSRSS